MKVNKIKQLRNILGLSQLEMANILKIKQNAYSNIETGKVSLTDKNKSILATTLGLNTHWFESEDNEALFVTESPLSNLLSDKYYGTLKANKSEKERVREATFKTLDMYQNPQATVNNKNNTCIDTKPRIPLTAAAGSLSEAARGVTLEECEQMPVISQFPSYDFTIFIKGDSMSPKYESGDEIACRWIDQTRFIQWGKIHVLDTTQGIIVKKVYDDGDKIRCVSINPDYPAFSIPKEDIHSMSIVIGALCFAEM